MNSVSNISFQFWRKKERKCVIPLSYCNENSNEVDLFEAIFNDGSTVAGGAFFFYNWTKGR